MALIYIVEDDEPIRRELIDILARAGFEIEACESFEHVSRDILAAAPDLVLLDLARSMVTNTQTGTSTELTKNELRILSLLLSRAGKIVSRSAIMQDLWDSDAFVDDNTLTVNINRLRTTLEKIGIKGYLTTHRGQGYSV